MENDTFRFLSTLWHGGQYSYYWTAPDKISYWMPVGEVETQFCPNGGQNVYFGVNPVLQIPSFNAQGIPRPAKFIRSQNNYIGAVNALFGEFDFDKFGNTDAIRDHLKQFPFPSIAIFSGGGYHFYWLLEDTFLVNTDADRERIRAAQANWVDFIGSDKQSKDLARVLRVPGTINYKEQYGPDFPTVRITKEDYSKRYYLAQLEELSKPPSVDAPLPLPAPEHNPIPDDVDYFRCQALSTAAKMVKDAIDGEKHGTLLRAARLLGGYVAGGIVTEAEAEHTLQVEIRHRQDVKSVDLADKTIANGLNYGKAHPIPIEQRQAERENWQRQNGKSKPEPIQDRLPDRQYWARQHVGMWERVR